MSTNAHNPLVVKLIESSGFIGEVRHIYAPIATLVEQSFIKTWQPLKGQSSIQHALIASYPIIQTQQQNTVLCQQAHISLMLTNQQLWCFTLTAPLYLDLKKILEQLPTVAHFLLSQKYPFDSHDDVLICQQRIEQLADLSINNNVQNDELVCPIRCEIALQSDALFSINSVNRVCNKVCAAIFNIVYSHQNSTTNPQQIKALQPLIYQQISDSKNGAHHLQDISLCDAKIAENINNLMLPTSLKTVIAPNHQAEKNVNTKLKINQQIYNYFVTPNAILQRNRVQACKQLPWLLEAVIAPFFAHNWQQNHIANAAKIQRAQTVLNAIDNGAPLFKTVAKVYNVTPAVIKSTQQQSAPNDALFNSKNIAHYLLFLNELPPEKRHFYPEIASTLSDIIELNLSVLAGYFGDLNGSALLTHPLAVRLIGEYIKSVFKADLNSTQTALKKWNRHFWYQALEEFLQEISRAWVQQHGGLNITKIEVQITRQNALLSHSQRQARDEFIQQLLSRMSMQALQNFANQWLQKVYEQQKIMMRWKDVSALQTWPAILSKPLQLEHVIATELNSVYAIKNHGQHQQNCLAAPNRYHYQSDRLVFALINTQTQQNTTLECQLKAPNNHIQINQHRAAKNTEPPDSLIKAAEKLLTLLNSTEHEPARKKRLIFQQQAMKRDRQRAEFVTEKTGEYEAIGSDLAWEMVGRFLSVRRG